MDLERNRKANPFLILVSVLFLTGLLTILYSWHGEPGNGESYRILAELRSLQEDGRFLSPHEPLAFLLLSLWKSVLSLNYIPAYISFGAFFLSVAVHLCAYLLERETWKLNQYLLCYLAALNPMVYGVPFHHLPELVSLSFLLLLFLSFRMETVVDLLILVSCTLLGLFSHFTFFLVGFTIFVIKAGTVGLREKKKNQSVFFKRRNIPKLFLFGYLSIFVVTVILLGNLDFYGKQSFAYMGRQAWSYLLGFGTFVFILGAGTFLLRSEKELNSLPASIAIFFLLATSGYFTVRPIVSLDSVKLNSLSKDIVSLRGRGVLDANQRIFVNGDTAAYVYFYTKQRLSFQERDGFSDHDYILISEIWPVDRKLLQREVKSKSAQYLFVSGDRILINGLLWKRIQNDPSLKTLKHKSIVAKQELESDSGYDRFRAFLTETMTSSKTPRS
ncbi:putative membrane protein [Leptospira inadai serovar Lyme str. 10]|uniref:Dolichyl-phosphate-mannose-protein mannosyltransferase n=2 Tax=Leptospira inadai serovar Lyme TaxID=293084 RepID=A0ABX4YNK7_9LEPT|nr:hypothetical protein [Leptospira inadai]EQA35784.1 putative membrane protein [Leptospira inadai serovar Lyme str. 10]PNV76729.1 hypothetical protein BES34_000075 [Leptospira inadai serovar Lyme]